MAKFFKIERQDCHHRTQYLVCVRPTHWSLLPEDAIRFNDVTVIYACKWLVGIGESFTVRCFTDV